jgi:tRNA CCA-adding enzyme
MELKKLIKELDFSPSKKEYSYLKRETEKFIELMKIELIKSKVDADVFVGGSFAKGTLARSEDYDSDVFIRFGWREGVHLSDLLEKVVKKVAKKMGEDYERLHGSRDYFIIRLGGKLTFEIIPVLRAKNIKMAGNVTDLSYFHVNYVKRNLKALQKGDVLLAKKFCSGAGVYGAESYINGFSGYALECLIIQFGSFERMLRELIRVKERLILDPGRHYKRKGDVVFSLNENKISGPLVLVDPVSKDRNVLAALNSETFEKFQKAARGFLRNPSKKFFEVKVINGDKLKKKNGEFVHIVLKTDRQEGDIAGTKMRKFARFLVGEVGRYFDVFGEEFSYAGGKSADFYLVGNSKKEVVRAGPPLDRKKDVRAFRKKNKITFEKNGILHSRMKVDFSLGEFLERFKREYNGKVREMGIVGFEVSS